MDLAGPKVGDSASLWNFTPSPGWTKDEVVALKLALEKFGIGRWVQIVDSGVLPGKLIQQLNGQTQRLLGQQSLAAFTGLHVDVDAVRKDNEAKQGPDVTRKSGLIINTGGTTDKATLELMRRENEIKYGLSKAHVDAVVLPAPVKTAHATATLERQVQAGGHRAKSKAAKAAARPAVVAVMAAQADLLSHGQRLSLLRALYQRLHKLLGLRGGAAAPADAPAGDKQAPAAAAAPGRKRGRAAPAGDGDAEARATRPRGKAAADAGKAAAGPVASLVAMGFDAKMSADALEETGGDVERAVAWLFANTQS